jgi:hypothetical protein
LERIWKVVAPRYYLTIFLEGLRNATKNVMIADIPAEIQTEYPPKADPKKFI